MKIRLDRLLVERGLAPTREKAQAMILAGLVTVGGRRVEKAGEGKLKVTGDLTIRDVTKPVVLDVTMNKAGVRQGRPAVGFDASTTIKRSEFGLGMMVPNVSDEVTLRISTEATVPKSDAEKKADAEKAAAAEKAGEKK